MTPLQFLKALWPDEGFYCLATPFKLPSMDHAVYKHAVRKTIEEAASFATKNRDNLDIFFAIHSLKEPFIFDARKKNYKTGELGAKAYRTQANSCAARCFFFDLDVGESTDTLAKYATQLEALIDLRRFCKVAKLPKPMIVSSGGGLHVYWLLDANLMSDDWRPEAGKLRRIAEHHKLKIDPSRTVDSASVLRVAGTFNHKRGQKRPVEVMQEGVVSHTSEFIKRLDDAVIRDDIKVRYTPLTAPKTMLDSVLGVQDGIEFDGPKVSMKALMSACAQIDFMARNQPKVGHNAWYAGIGAVRCVENGEKWVHKFSENYPDYSEAETDQRMRQWEGFGPTSCVKIAEAAGDKLCEGCAFAGKVKGPLVAARHRDYALPPKVVEVIDDVATEIEIVPPPKPYARLRSGQIAIQAKNKDGDEESTVIYEYDLYPVKRRTDKIANTEQHEWRVHLPHEPVKTLVLEAGDLADERKLTTALFNQGVISNDPKTLRHYMTAYIQELQRRAAAEPQYSHLGWITDHTEFVLPDRVLTRSGKSRPVTLSVNASRSARSVKRKGTLAKQVELMRFYSDPKYVAQQFFMLSGLGSPLFHMTGHHGVVVNASGPAGASKSSSLYSIGAWWGDPDQYVINGTQNGSSAKGRNLRAGTLSNLPVCVDEITHMASTDASAMAMGVTQPAPQLVSTQGGQERLTVDVDKSSIMLTTANTSLHGLLSTNNAAGTAGSMRVFEIAFSPTDPTGKAAADDFLMELRENYGHIGPAFMQYVVTNYDAVKARVRAVNRDLDTMLSTWGAERFWSADAAVAIVTAEIANQLGLLDWDIATVRHWVIHRQFPRMRGVVSNEYQSPVSVLAEFLGSIKAETLIVESDKYHGQEANATEMPLRSILARHVKDTNTTWVLYTAFREYCHRTHAVALTIMEELSDVDAEKHGKSEAVIAYRKKRIILGKGTAFDTGQVWCFGVNLMHPDLAGELTPAAIAARKEEAERRARIHQKVKPLLRVVED